MQQNQGQGGLIWTTTAFIVWGLLPLFYQHLKGVEAMEIFAFRVLWSVPMMALVLWVTVTPVRVFKLLLEPKTFFWLFLSTACISTSWYLNTWGVTNGQVLMVSLAFFLIPIFNILIGVVFLKETLRPFQKLALLFCLIGFGYACLSLDTFPWLTVGISIAFGCYGLIKKQIKIDTLNGLTAETILMVPFALFYLIGAGQHVGYNPTGENVQMLLMMTAPLTILPLGLFAFGVKRMQNLSSIAILQYLEPTLYFLLAVFVFKEAVDSDRLITFGLVWIGFILFALDSLRSSRSLRKQRRQMAAA